MRKSYLGILIGIFLFLIVGAAKQPATKPAEPVLPQCSQLSTCEERILCRLNFWSDFYVRMKVPYVWGGDWGLLGMDCSGSIKKICKLAGLGYPRLTSRDIWLNKGAWPGERVFVRLDEHDIAQFPNLLFWTYKENRPFGHVALTVWNALDKNGKHTILFREASFSKGYFKETEMKEGDYRWKKLVGVLILDLSPGFDCGGK